jgi:hypothetical protein
VRALILSGVLALLGLACAGCRWLEALGDSRPKALEMEVMFEVQKDGRYPVAGALVSTASRSLGASDRDGRLLARLRGTAGERVALQVRCPSGYYAASAPESLAIRPVLSLANAVGQRLHVPIACETTERSIAILVRAETQPNLPVVARGQEVARTDADGLAHVLLAATPGEELSVEIVTTDAPALRPQSPRRQFRIGNQDEVFVMHEKFSVRKPPAPRRPRVVHAPAPALPYAL